LDPAVSVISVGVVVVGVVAVVVIVVVSMRHLDEKRRAYLL
jgi:hypothetical protein